MSKFLNITIKTRLYHQPKLGCLALRITWFYSTRFVTLSIVVAPSDFSAWLRIVLFRISSEFTRFFKIYYYIKPLLLTDYIHNLCFLRKQNLVLQIVYKIQILYHKLLSECLVILPLSYLLLRVLGWCATIYLFYM